MKKNWFNFLFLFFLQISAQSYTKNDSLKGSNTQFRNWWDVQFYEITVETNSVDKSIQGKVEMRFNKINETNHYKMQIDLQQPMQVSSFKIIFLDKNKTSKTIPKNLIERKYDFYFLDLSSFKDLLDKHETVLEMQFSGQPKIAKQPPWKGGWVFEKDKNGNDFISVACQTDGASLWYPNKDFWGDEPNEGAILNIITPKNLVGIGNGKLIQKRALENDKTQYTWIVTNPINTYNIVPYIGKYRNFNEVYNGKEGLLNLDYWVLQENLTKAKNQFEQVKPMMQCFEDWFGAYPFYQDSYKLVEAPYLGMEHQSNIAYGNQYKNGYLGLDLSQSGWGLDWDYILVHESGHEWFGNAISANDMADMWIHEAFTTYSEVLFTECKHGKKAANEYAIGLRMEIENKEPIIGKYGVNKEGSVDMYRKGANMIHSFRQILDDEILFKNLLKKLMLTFKNKTINSEILITKINEFTGKDFTNFFNQYLKTTEIPRLLIKKQKNKIQYKWDETQTYPQSFSIKLKDGTWLYPNPMEWKIIKLTKKNKFVLDSKFYIELKEIK